jgi:uncharacterized protein
MPWPKRFRKILEEPQIRCFKPDIEGKIEELAVEITIDEFEAIRLKDYKKISQN